MAIHRLATSYPQSNLFPSKRRAAFHDFILLIDSSQFDKTKKSPTCAEGIKNVK